jgi:hypothetical protein
MNAIRYVDIYRSAKERITDPKRLKLRLKLLLRNRQRVLHKEMGLHRRQAEGAPQVEHFDDPISFRF